MTEDERLKRLRLLARSSIVGADIKWIVGEYDRLQAELKEASRCKHPTKRGTGSVSTDGKIVTSELWCDTCGEKLT